MRFLPDAWLATRVRRAGAVVVGLVIIAAIVGLWTVGGGDGSPPPATLPRAVARTVIDAGARIDELAAWSIARRTDRRLGAEDDALCATIARLVAAPRDGRAPSTTYHYLEAMLALETGNLGRPTTEAVTPNSLLPNFRLTFRRPAARLALAALPPGGGDPQARDVFASLAATAVQDVRDADRETAGLRTAARALMPLQSETARWLAAEAMLDDVRRWIARRDMLEGELGQLALPRVEGVAARAVDAKQTELDVLAAELPPRIQAVSAALRRRLQDVGGAVSPAPGEAGPLAELAAALHDLAAIAQAAETLYASTESPQEVVLTGDVTSPCRIVGRVLPDRDLDGRSTVAIHDDRPCRLVGGPGGGVQVVRSVDLDVHVVVEEVDAPSAVGTGSGRIRRSSRDLDFGLTLSDVEVRAEGNTLRLTSPERLDAVAVELPRTRRTLTDLGLPDWARLESVRTRFQRGALELELAISAPALSSSRIAWLGAPLRLASATVDLPAVAGRLRGSAEDAVRGIVAAMDADAMRCKAPGDAEWILGLQLGTPVPHLEGVRVVSVDPLSIDADVALPGAEGVAATARLHCGLAGRFELRGIVGDADAAAAVVLPKIMTYTTEARSAASTQAKELEASLRSQARTLEGRVAEVGRDVLGIAGEVDPIARAFPAAELEGALRAAIGDPRTWGDERPPDELVRSVESALAVAYVRQDRAHRADEFVAEVAAWLGTAGDAATVDAVKASATAAGRELAEAVFAASKAALANGFATRNQTFEEIFGAGMLTDAGAKSALERAATAPLLQIGAGRIHERSLMDAIAESWSETIGAATQGALKPTSAAAPQAAAAEELRLRHNRLVLVLRACGLPAASRPPELVAVASQLDKVAEVLKKAVEGARSAASEAVQAPSWRVPDGILATLGIVAVAPPAADVSPAQRDLIQAAIKTAAARAADARQAAQGLVLAAIEARCAGWPEARTARHLASQAAAARQALIPQAGAADLTEVSERWARFHVVRAKERLLAMPAAKEIVGRREVIARHRQAVRDALSTGSLGDLKAAARVAAVRLSAAGERSPVVIEADIEIVGKEALRCTGNLSAVTATAALAEEVRRLAAKAVRLDTLAAKVTAARSIVLGEVLDHARRAAWPAFLGDLQLAAPIENGLKATIEVEASALRARMLAAGAVVQRQAKALDRALGNRLQDLGDRRLREWDAIESILRDVPTSDVVQAQVDVTRYRLNRLGPPGAGISAALATLTTALGGPDPAALAALKALDRPGLTRDAENLAATGRAALRLLDELKALGGMTGAEPGTIVGWAVGLEEVVSAAGLAALPEVAEAIADIRAGAQAALRTGIAQTVDAAALAPVSVALSNAAKEIRTRLTSLDGEIGRAETLAKSLRQAVDRALDPDAIAPAIEAIEQQIQAGGGATTAAVRSLITAAKRLDGMTILDSKKHLHTVAEAIEDLAAVARHEREELVGKLETIAAAGGDVHKRVLTAVELRPGTDAWRQARDRLEASAGKVGVTFARIADFSDSRALRRLAVEAVPSADLLAKAVAAGLPGTDPQLAARIGDAFTKLDATEALARLALPELTVSLAGSDVYVGDVLRIPAFVDAELATVTEQVRERAVAAAKTGLAELRKELATVGPEARQLLADARDLASAAQRTEAEARQAIDEVLKRRGFEESLDILGVEWTVRVEADPRERSVRATATFPGNDALPACKIVGGLDVRFTAGKVEIKPNFSTLRTEPALETIVQRALSSAIDGLSFPASLRREDRMITGRVRYAPAGFPIPVEVDLTVDIADKSVRLAVDGRGILRAAVRKAVDAIKAQVTRNGLPGIGPLQVTKLDLIDDVPRGFGLALGAEVSIPLAGRALTLGVDLEARPGEGLRVKRIDAAQLQGLATEALSGLLPSGIELDAPAFAFDKGLRIFLKVNVAVPVLGMGLTTRLEVGTSGVTFRGAIRLDIPGWFDVPPVSFGDLGASLDLQRKVLGLHVSVAVSPGAVSSNIFKVKGTGEIDLKSIVVTLRGDLLLARVITLAGSTVRIDPGRGEFDAEAATAPMLEKVLKLGGSLKIRTESRPNVSFAASGRVFGLEILDVDGKFDWELAGELNLKATLLLTSTDVSLRFEERLRNPTLDAEVKLVNLGPFAGVVATVHASNHRILCTAEASAGVSVRVVLDLPGLDDLTPGRLLEALLAQLRVSVGLPKDFRVSVGAPDATNGSETGAGDKPRGGGVPAGGNVPAPPAVVASAGFEPWKLAAERKTWNEPDGEEGGIKIIIRFGGRKKFKPRQEDRYLNGADAILHDRSPTDLVNGGVYFKTYNHTALSVDNQGSVSFHDRSSGSWTRVWTGRAPGLDLKADPVWHYAGIAIVRTEAGVLAALEGATLPQESDRACLVPGSYAGKAFADLVRDDRVAQLAAWLYGWSRLVAREPPTSLRGSGSVALMSIGSKHVLVTRKKDGSGLLFRVPEGVRFEADKEVRGPLIDLAVWGGDGGGGLAALVPPRTEFDMRGSGMLVTSGSTAVCLLLDATPSETSGPLAIVTPGGVTPGRWTAPASKGAPVEETVDGLASVVWDKAASALAGASGPTLLSVGRSGGAQTSRIAAYFNAAPSSAAPRHEVAFMGSTLGVFKEGLVDLRRPWDEVQAHWNARLVLLPDGTAAPLPPEAFLDLLVRGDWELRGFRANPLGSLRKPE